VLPLAPLEIIAAYVNRKVGGPVRTCRHGSLPSASRRNTANDEGRAFGAGTGARRQPAPESAVGEAAEL